MSRKKPKNEVEELEKQIRDLKSLNRALMRRLKKVDRNYRETLSQSEKELDNEQDQKIEEAKSRRSCGHCERGELVEVNIVGRIFTRCSVCDWRSGVKKKED
jgi:hypothetical protein